ncbi:MAG: DUF177 domain-containing protein [Eggerthellaceae bacterium]|nr:DUF177 domain-containing protein [Eggerthellaceae bacterium]
MSDTIIKIPAELFALAECSHFQGEYDLPELAMGPDDYTFAAPLAWRVDVTNTGAALLVEGAVTGSGTCACSRCLEDVQHDFNGQIEGYFLIGVDSAPRYDDDDEELGEDEFDVLPEDHMLDLAPLIQAALMVDAPDMPLCRDDCAGLCPQCGANLNEGPCGCGEDPELAAFEKQANPFSALADFKFE